MDYALQPAGEIPKPATSTTARTRPRKYPFHEMRVGEMFFAPGSKPTTMMSLACATGKRLSFTFKTRHLHMRQTDAGWAQCSEGADGALLGVAVYRVA